MVKVFGCFFRNGLLVGSLAGRWSGLLAGTKRKNKQNILSEISLLADDIGIIDHGVLLEESSMDELEKKNRKYIQLQVSDIPKASLILERQFHVTDYAVQDEHNLRLYDTALDMAAINKALVVQDVAVISSQICNDTLEDYFKQITGGEGIA